VPHESPTSLCLDVDPLDLVALTLIEGFGPVTVREHLRRIRYEARPIDDGLPRGIVAAVRKAAREKLATAQRIGARCIVDGEPDFPLALQDLESVPTHVWTMGDLAVLRDRPTVSIVGTRQLTSYGERATRSLANAFARNGATVISGMARGIDSVAHVSTMEVGGKTVAVLGTGIDVPYPASNRPLHRKIRDHGLIISEAAPGAAAHRGSFPTRNRLIAALGQATIVVEAGWKSGALITADVANAIGRAVGIVPGPIDSPTSLGSNQRLRDGIGHCIAVIDDALELVGISESGKLSVVFKNGSEEAVWLALERPAANFDVLTGRTGLPARLCLETVTALELRGLVDCGITGEVRRR
jgi:DNA processing protein